MIKEEELTLAGRINKPHGIKGEMSATLDVDADLEDVKCIIFKVEGIFVPFFVQSVRPKTNDTDLVTLEGIDSEEKARKFTMTPFYLLNEDVDMETPDFDEGFYASDLIGFTVIDANHGKLGTVSDVNDLTENVLFIISSPDGQEMLLPVADEFIVGIDADNRTLKTSYPTEIIELNK